MPTIYIDADACPVKSEIYKVAARYHWPVVVVSNMFIATPDSPDIQNVVVPVRFNSADNWIIQHVAPDDIVVTEDIVLAGRCIDQGAIVIGTRGQRFSEGSMGEALASRELMAQLRDQGLVASGPAPFRNQDRSQFLQRLDQTINEVHRRQKRRAPQDSSATDSP